jgi:hypothetical protein
MFQRYSHLSETVENQINENYIYFKLKTGIGKVGRHDFHRPRDGPCNPLFFKTAL